MKGPQPKPLSERFWSKVDQSGDCWIWTAHHLSSGYGLIGTGSMRDGTRRGSLAHRVSWELAYGTIPDGLFVCHRCDNPSCVRPDHLFLGTCKDNAADSVAKGRMHF